MMRYQSVNPDCFPLTNPKKPTTTTTTTTLKVCKEEHHHLDTDKATHEAKLLQPIKPRSQAHSFTHFSADSPEPTAGSGDLLLRWGQNKRSRGSRAGIGDDPFRHAKKDAQRRYVGGRDKAKHVVKAAAAAPAILPPPPPLPSPSPSSGGGYKRGTNLRPSVPTNRNIEERFNSHYRFEKLFSTSPKQKMHRTTTNRMVFSAQLDAPTTCFAPSEREAGGGVSSTMLITKSEKMMMSPGSFEWPRIYLSLSRKEKEEDFYAMKGTKLPHRPKKRAKNVDKTLQYCFPGLWLSDLTRGRYEVREKKCVKRKKRGLKAMEFDSESE